MFDSLYIGASSTFAAISYIPRFGIFVAINNRTNYIMYYEIMDFSIL